jgi:hypothetical protein
MFNHWSVYLVVGGLALDVLDALTTKAGSDGGLVYGTGGFLRSVNQKLPGVMNLGEVLATVGAVGFVLKHGR